MALLTHQPKDVEMEDEFMKGFISKACDGEICSMCHAKASHKVGEEIPHDDPYPSRHNFTAYVCCECFQNLFGDAVFCENGEE